MQPYYSNFLTLDDGKEKNMFSKCFKENKNTIENVNFKLTWPLFSENALYGIIPWYYINIIF